MNMMPSTIIAASGFGQRTADPRIQTWVELRFAHAPLTMAEILFAVRDRASTVTLGLVDQLLLGWHRMGLIERKGRPVAWAMVSEAKRQSNPPELPPAAPRHWTERRGPRARMWTAMRVLKRFDLVQLTLSADVPEPLAKQFLSVMERAGYVRRQGDRWAQGARPWGPKPPAVTYMRLDEHTVMRVRDRNSDVVFDIRLHSPRSARSALFFDRGD